MKPLNESRQGEIAALCLMVERGKPAALLPIPSREIPAAYDWVKRVSDCRVYFEPLAPHWMSLWVYKRPWILEVIKRASRQPTDLMAHWINGKLFGYSDDAIEEYLSRNGCLDLCKQDLAASGAGGQGVGAVVERHEFSAVIALVRPLARLLAGLRHRITSLMGIFVSIATKILQGGCDR